MTVAMSLEHKFDYLDQLIGNTPMVEITYKYKGKLNKIYAKSEQYNFTGSIKDRMALHIYKEAYKHSRIKQTDIVVEATSGNAGIALAGVGVALGHKVKIFMPNWLSTERINLIRSFGADIELVSKEDGGFLGSIAKANQMAVDQPNVFLSKQFDNEDNVSAHCQTTGPEIFTQLQSIGVTPKAFVAGVGTGGTVMGCGKFLSKIYDGIAIHPLEPANSPTLSTGHKVGKHRIQGISDDFIPSILKLDNLAPVVSVDDGDAIIAAQMLSTQLGLSVGISSGANFIGAVMLQQQLGENSPVVTVFPDSNKKYFSTDYVQEEPVKEGFLSPDIELVDFRAIARTAIYNKYNG